jgi:diketogulonate reductase-like aldo/keto reductase
MGFVSAFFRILFTRIVPVLVISVAVLLGWLGRAEIPEGRFFATIVPLLKGVAPPTIVGHGKMQGTPAVPVDMELHPRPEKEILLTLAGSGDNMPANGLGMCCRPTAYDDELVKRTVLWYLLLGGRLIDGAHIYLNHRAIGEAIREAMKRGVPREEIFFTTKLYPSHYGYNKTKETVPKFLDELGLEYIDLVLMHFPVRFPSFLKLGDCTERGISVKECRQETFRALSELREEGIMRNVGVSNFAVHHLKDLEELENVAPIAVNQIQLNPWSPQAWMDTAKYCQQNNIAVTAYNSLGGFMQHAEAETTETLIALGEKYNKTVAQILLRYALQMNYAVIPGTGNPEHMKQNLAVYDFELTDDEMGSIEALRSDESAKKFFSMEPVD